MNKSNIIKEFIYETIIKDDDRKNIVLEDDTNLIVSGILDSYAIVNIMFFIEERFNVNISDEINFDNFTSIEDICKLI